MQQQLATRPLVTAGVALTAVGMVAAPVAAPAPPPEIAVPDIQLTATFDPITPWLDVLTGAANNATALFDTWGGAPLPILQQIGVNQVDNLDSLITVTGTVGGIFNQTVDNLQAAIAAPFSAYEPLLDTTQPVFGGLLGAQLECFLVTCPFPLGPELDLSHQGIFHALNLATSGNAVLNELLGFTASPVSGILLGAVGPIVGPAIALVNGVTGAVDNISDPLTALNDLLNIPAQMTDAFLNGGQVLDAAPLLTGLLSDVPMFQILLNYLSLDTLGFEMGGLLSPGGSLFSAFTVGATLLPGTEIGDGFASMLLPGADVGAIGSTLLLAQAVAEAIGWGGTGMPADVFDPGLIDLSFLGDNALANLIDIPNLLLGGLLGIF